MTLDEYIESKRTLYSEFAACVANILEAALSVAGTRDTVPTDSIPSQGHWIFVPKTKGQGKNRL